MARVRSVVLAHDGRCGLCRARRSDPEHPRAVLGRGKSPSRQGNVLSPSYLFPRVAQCSTNLTRGVCSHPHICEYTHIQRVFVTGGPSQLPGLIPRLNASIRPILPPEMELNVMQAADPFNDAWRGMADFAQTDAFARVGVTKAEYEEWGGERIKRWWGGNWTSSVPPSESE